MRSEDKMLQLSFEDNTRLLALARVRGHVGTKGLPTLEDFKSGMTPSGQAVAECIVAGATCTDQEVRATAEAFIRLTDARSAAR